jgi:hypothetical protein
VAGVEPSEPQRHRAVPGALGTRLRLDPSCRLWGRIRQQCIELAAKKATNFETSRSFSDYADDNGYTVERRQPELRPLILDLGCFWQRDASDEPK